VSESELFLNGTSAHIRLFSARKWCENVMKERKYNQGYLYSYDKMQKASNIVKVKLKVGLIKQVKTR